MWLYLKTIEFIEKYQKKEDGENENYKRIVRNSGKNIYPRKDVK